MSHPYNAPSGVTWGFSWADWHADCSPVVVADGLGRLHLVCPTCRVVCEMEAAVGREGRCCPNDSRVSTATKRGPSA